MWFACGILAIFYRTGLFKLAISEDQPFSADMLAFVRIFTASLNTLEVWLQDKKAPDNLRNVCLTKEDTKPLEFLEKRYVHSFRVTCVYFDLGACCY